MAEVRPITAQQAPAVTADLFSNASERIVLQGFHVEDCMGTQPQLDSFEYSRAEEKLMLIDAYSHWFVGDEIKPWSAEWRAKRRALLERMARIREAGGTARFIHEDVWTRIPPIYSGRSHVKLALADDTVVAGGIDCNSMSPASIDVSLLVKDERFADWITHICQVESSTGGSRAGQHRYKIDDQTEFFIDGGKRGESEIYEQACQLAGSSDTTAVTHYSQYIPNSRLFKIYNQLTPQVQVVTNNPRRLPRPYRYEQLLLERRARQAGKIALQYVEMGNYMHAKVVFYQRKNQPDVMILGSHNLQGKDVEYGTAETAFITTDTHLIAAVRSYLETQT